MLQPERGCPAAAKRGQQKKVRGGGGQGEGAFNLQQRSLLGRLLLHLLQQPLDLPPQLCLQLWLDDVGQRGRKRGAQRVNVALQPTRRKGTKGRSAKGPACTLQLTPGARSREQNVGKTPEAAKYCTQ